MERIDIELAFAWCADYCRKHLAEYEAFLRENGESEEDIQNALKDLTNA